jgi:tetratricopeptide (TPR) repeat protein
MDPERRRTVARRVGAGNYLFGTIHAVGNRLRIQAGIYDARSRDGSAVSQLNVDGDATEVLALVDQLAARLLVERGETPGRLFHAATLTTQSLPALKSFLTAEQSLRSGPAGIDSAIAGFQRAVSEDSTFALAYYRLAVASGWQLRHEVASAATAAALRHSTRLAERDRRLLQAYGDYRAGRVAEAEPAFRDLVRDDPGDLEAAFQLADLLAYYNPLRGRSQAEPLELFQRVLGFDPGFLCPI